MSQLIPFEFNGNSVRVVTDNNGDPWFVASDVCEALTISNYRDAVAKLDDDEKHAVGIADAIGRYQETLTINESGLYSLVLTSRKPEAKKFKKWVTSEVLPSIRKTGSYSVASIDPMQALNDPATSAFMPGKRKNHGIALPRSQRRLAMHIGALHGR